MSIKVSNVSKYYGKQKALNDVSFEIKKGEILGFLGPNGAGKSTMMKIITTFIPPSDGNVTVCGFDTSLASMEVRKKVGYLPEHNPLYLDMYVKEYLQFIGGLHRIKDTKLRVKEMIEITGLGNEQHKRIGALSKGYRQRVGLAQAIIHNPEVLILDEPTSGLDPNQLEEIRNLIKELGKEKTVMFSTHIMQEVEAVCDRVIIINQGSIVADKQFKELKGASDVSVSVLVEFDKEVTMAQLTKIEGVSSALLTGKNQWQLNAKSDIDIRPMVFQFAIKENLTVLTISRNEKSLEQVFRDLTTSGR